MTDQTTETRVAEIEKRAEKATEGPWEWSGAGGEYYGLRSLKGKDVLEVHDGIVYSEYSSDSATVSCGYEDSLFIPHAREDIPWLLSQLRAAWKREAALREALLKIKGITSEAFNTADYMGISKQMELKIAKVHRVAVLQETPDER